MQLKFSIITVCLNAEDNIKKTLDSVKKQTYLNIEHIIIDGKSTDNTINIINENIIKNNIIISEKDRGIYQAMNKGIKIANGDIIAFLNAGDFYTEKSILEKINEYFIDNIKIVYGNISYFNEKLNKPTGRKFIPGYYIKNSYLNAWHPPHPAFFCKKECFEYYGYFDENLEISGDFELMFRFQEMYNLPASYIDRQITYMTTGGASSKISNILKGNKNILKTFKKYDKKINMSVYLFKRFFPKLIEIIKSKINIF